MKLDKSNFKFRKEDFEPIELDYEKETWRESVCQVHYPLFYDISQKLWISIWNQIEQLTLFETMT